MSEVNIPDLDPAAALTDADLVEVYQPGQTPGTRNRSSALGDLAKRTLIPIGVACSDESTNITAGNAKVTFRMPFAFKLAEVRASLTAAQASGSIFTVDINETGASILSTKLTIDNNERTSTTAAAPPVISDADLADDAEITVDVDQVGDPGAKGLKIWLIGRRA